MKNKILIMLLALAFLCPGLQAKEKDAAKFVAGIVMAASGGLLACNGFQMVDVSAPSLDMQSFNKITTGSGQWIITTDGLLKNTGNVDLKNITINVYYMDSLGAEITNTVTAISAPLAAGGSTSLFIAPVSMGTEPFFFSVKYGANFDRRLENFSVQAGIAGCAVFAAGVFLICDYIFDIEDFLEKNDSKVRLSAVNNGFTLMTSKSF